MSEEKKSVLIAGATGLVGGFCLARFLADESYGRITVLGRRELPHPPDDPRLVQVVTDFERLSEHAGKLVADDVVIALGSTLKKAGSRANFHKVDFGHSFAVARIARENGAKQLLLISALGADRKSVSFYSRVKGDLEEAVRGLNYPSLSIFRPSLIMGRRREFRPTEELAKSIVPWISFAIPRRYRAIPAETIAAALWLAARIEKPGLTVYESEAIDELYHSVKKGWK